MMGAVLRPLLFKERTMIVKLDVRARILVLNMLRQHQGDILLMKVIKNTLDAIGFNKDELNAYGFKFNADTGETQWSEGSAVGKDFEIDEIVVGLVASKLKELSKTGKLGLDYVDIWDIFVGE